MITLIVVGWISFLLGWLLCSMVLIRRQSEYLARGLGRTREISSYSAMECRRRAEARDR